LSQPLLSAEGLVKDYPLGRDRSTGRRGTLRAVDGVSFRIEESETLGWVGESGSGKSTLARLLLRFEPPTAGAIRFLGNDWLEPEGKQLRKRRRDIQIVFQDPLASLDPRKTVGDSVGEPLRSILPAREKTARVDELLASVGLAPGVRARYPHELSGGQRQRAGIARAIAPTPRLIVCDEPLSALDVSVAAQIQNLFSEIQEKSGVSYFFISHEVASVARASRRLGVMYAGRLIEEGPAAEIAARPLHPYTAALVARRALPGEPPSPVRRPPGCAFAPRCPIARPRCRAEVPELAPRAPGRRAACFYPGEIAYPSKL
jgi:oligopeptide/dipeptide ABC transporter ATP-binding protein